MKVTLCVAATIGMILLVSSTGRTRDDPDNNGSDQMIKARSTAFIAAFDNGDAKALAAFWAPNGDYMDELGHHYKGRKQIADSFRKLFADGKGLKMRVHRTSLRLVRPDLAIGDGYYEVVPPNGAPPTSTRYTTVQVKQDGKWYFESVREAIATPPSRDDKLEALGWLIGDWGDEAKSGEVAHISFEWAENNNFIVASFTTTLKDVPVAGATQWIGYDAAAKKARSWSFDSSGGITEAVWTSRGNKLVSHSTTTLRDGKKVTATNIVTRVDDDHITWQSTKRSLAGKELPDTEVVKLMRLPPE
jgi:uncharacterized protein (TIGR02246 family)